MTAGTNILGFITRYMVPKGVTVTYGYLVCNIKHSKTEMHCTRLTVGDNLINFDIDKSTATADLTTITSLFNSIISTPKARFCTADTYNIYFDMHLAKYEYIKLHLEIIHDKIIQQYNLLDIAVNGWIYCEIKKGMYGLPYTGKIANERLMKHLEPYG